jgi:hypothetical protein
MDNHRYVEDLGRRPNSLSNFAHPPGYRAVSLLLGPNDPEGWQDVVSAVGERKAWEMHITALRLKLEHARGRNDGYGDKLTVHRVGMFLLAAEQRLAQLKPAPRKRRK